MMSDDLTLFDFNSPDKSGEWETTHDTVMGGRSTGTISVSNDRLVFAGEVSLENSGGFASARSRPHDRDLSGYGGIALICCGSPRTFALTIRTDFALRAGAYRCHFTPTDEVREFVFPFERFEPYSFGRTVPDAPPLNRRCIRSLGFLIGAKQAGLFRLEVACVTAFRSATSA